MSSEILHENMNISHLMVHSQQVEEIRIKRKNRDAKRARFYDGSTFKGKLEIQVKPKFKNIFFNQVPSNFPKAIKDRVSNRRSHGGKSVDSSSEKPSCT